MHIFDHNSSFLLEPQGRTEGFLFDTLERKVKPNAMEQNLLMGYTSSMHRTDGSALKAIIILPNRLSLSFKTFKIEGFRPCTEYYLQNKIDLCHATSKYENGTLRAKVTALKVKKATCIVYAYFRNIIENDKTTCQEPCNKPYIDRALIMKSLRL